MKISKIMFSAAVSVALLAFGAPALRADALAVVDLTPQLQNDGLAIQNLQAIEVGGVVVLRGRTADRAQAERAGVLLQKLGYKRVANLIETITAPDDAAITREAERRLASNPALDDCTLRVETKGGVVTVAGRINSELQRDVAADVLRDIDGVSAVKTDLRR